MGQNKLLAQATDPAIFQVGFMTIQFFKNLNIPCLHLQTREGFFVIYGALVGIDVTSDVQ